MLLGPFHTGNVYFEILFQNTSHVTAMRSMCAWSHIWKKNFAKGNMSYIVK